MSSIRQIVVTHSDRGTKLPTKDEFLQMASYIKKVAGINLPLSDKNLILVAGRLQRLQRRGLCNSYKELIASLERQDSRVVSAFVFALTTNTTSFFRENDHFEFLRKVLPVMAKGRDDGRPVRIWCNPCSTGEEAYSIAITAVDVLGTMPPVRILATDINEHVLRVGKIGEYPIQKQQELSDSIVVRFFETRHDGDEKRTAVVRGVRDLIHFGQFNLLMDYPFAHKFDAIFCRNVLIYFERKDAEYVVNKLRDQLHVGGYLFLGHSETAAGYVSGLRRIGPAIYIRE